MLSTSKGMRTINKYNFNYQKIKALLSIDSDDSIIEELLKPPETPNGIYYLYTIKDETKLGIKHVNQDIVSYNILSENSTYDFKNFVSEEFLGVYTSIDNIFRDWPEYVI
jgi:hypothetical protein